MPCTPFTANGMRGFICTRGPRPNCVCGARPSFQCDYPTQHRNRTCSRYLCASCATPAGIDEHLCPTHAQRVREGAAEREPVQEALF